MKSFSKKKKVLDQCNYGPFSNCSLTWNIRWSNLSMLGLFYSDYTWALSGTRFWPRFLHSPKMNLDYDSSSMLFDFFFPFVLLEQGKKNPTSAEYGGWGMGGGSVTSFTDNIFLHFNRNTVWQRRGLSSLWECVYLGLVTVWNHCIFGLLIWQTLLLLHTSSFPMHRLSLGNFSEGIISICSCFILFRTAGGSHQSVNPTLNGKDVQTMQWERRKIIDLVVGRSNKNNNTKIQWES